MRILHVLPYFSPKMGGVPRVAHDIATHLARRGHTITVVTGDYGYDESSFPQNGFQRILLHSVVSRSGFYVTPSLVAWARQHAASFDVIHLHEVRTFQNAVMRRYATAYGVPYVLSTHGTLPIHMQWKVVKKLCDLLFARALLAQAKRLVAVSPFEVEQFVQAGIEPGRFTFIPNGLDLDEFTSLPPRGSFRQKVGIAEDAKVVLFLGRLHHIKGIPFLTQAFARLLARQEDVFLVIAGPDAGELDKLQLLRNRLAMQDRVYFAGPLYGSEKLAAYVDADVLASPSVYEIFGLVPFEALMCGTPIIVTDHCGTGQLVRDAGIGYTVPYGDIRTLAEILLRAVTNSEEVVQMVRAGQIFVREQLDWSSIVTKLEKLYSSVINERAG